MLKCNGTLYAIEVSAFFFGSGVKGYVIGCFSCGCLCGILMEFFTCRHVPLMFPVFRSPE